MNVTLIKNGCKVTSSNGLTATLVNEFRKRGYTCLPQVSYCACDADGTKQEMELLCSDVSSWPWFDPNDPASEEYLGTMIFEVDGLTSSTSERAVNSTVGGIYAAPVKTNQREIIVSGLMFALTERGMAYGRRWEQARWWNSQCECHDKAVSFRVDCEQFGDPDEGIVELNKVVTVSGPKYTKFRESGKCCDQITRFEVTLNALDAGFYSKSTPVLESVFDPYMFEHEVWECDVDDHICGPECCTSCKTSVLYGAFDLDPNCCYCRPLLVTKQCVSFKPVAVGSEVGFDFEFYSGSAVYENSRVVFVEGDCAVEDCDGNWLDRPVIAAFELNRIPEFSRLRINGKTGRVFFECDGKWVDGSAFVFGAGGLPFVNPRITSCVPFSVVVEADAGTVAEDAYVRVFYFQRRIG